MTDYLTECGYLASTLASHYRAWRKHPWAAAAQGLQSLADRHLARYETPIGEDCVLGPAWLSGLRALRVLLNAELGDLDAGICDRYLIDLASEHGCNLDE